MFKGVKNTWQTFVTRGREKVIFDTGRGGGGGGGKVIPLLGAMNK